MNLTIAMRVIGGFGVTSILLLFLGVNSIMVLKGISESTSQVNQVSVPALDASGKLQQKFVEMSKTTLIEYYSKTDQQVNSSVAQFNEEASEFKADFSLLKSIVQNDPELARALPGVESNYNKFAQEAQLLFCLQKNAH